MSNVVLYGRSFDFSADPAPQQKVNAAQLVTQLDFLFQNDTALKAAVDSFLRDDNSPQDALIKLRCLAPEVIALLQSAEGWQPKAGVTCATTANIALTGEQTIDGVVTLGSRVLVKDQAAPAQNGIYVTAGSAWARATDADEAAELELAFVVVQGGAVNKGSAWVITSASLTTVGTDPLTWAQVYGSPSGTAGGVLAGTFPDPTWSTADGGALQAGRNLLINGDGRFAQRKDYAATVPLTYAYGKADRWAGALDGTTVAGTFTRDAAAPMGQTGNAIKWSAVTTTGAGFAFFRQRVEARDAVRLKNRNATLSLTLRHDAGVQLAGTVYLRKANAADNFAAVTQIATAAFTADSGTNVPVTLSALMGDCSNGVEIEVVLTIGAVAAKSVWLTDAQLELGLTATPYEVLAVALERARCQRFYTKTYNASVAPGSFVDQLGNIRAVAYDATNLCQGSFRFLTKMRTTPTVTVYSTATGTAAKLRDITANADVGAATSFIGEEGCYVAGVGTMTAGHVMEFHLVADAEL